MSEITKKKHYWCTNCHIPLIKEICLNCGETGFQITTDLKPVFREEYNYYKKAALKFLKVNEPFFPKILYRHRNRLISDVSKGLTHYKIKVLQNISEDSEEFMDAGEYAIMLIDSLNEKGRSRIKSYFLDDSIYNEKLIQGNLKYLEEIENEAINYIKNKSKEFSNYFQISSFSGGKDSTVVANLVKNALGKDKVNVLFSDTGIEYPETINYIKKYGPEFGELIFLDCEVDFMNMCKQLGPPSRTMRWCCFTNKGAPVSKFYANLEKRKVLSFDGIRREESNLRANYPREKDNTKFEKQYSTYPILDWTTLEVWLYIIWRKLPYNNLYNHGFSRIGCWACPNNTKFDWYLFSKVYPKIVKDWFEFISNYKNQQVETMKLDENIEDSKTRYDFSWIEDGAWKSRRVKYHNEDNLLNLESPCGKHDFDLYLKNNVLDNLIEFFKVFGELNGTILPNGKKMYRVIHDEMVISYIQDSNAIKFYIQDENKTEKLKRLILRQINKSFNCINCGACAGACPQGAITINPSFHIDDDKCINCLICTGTKYIAMSCIALHYKENRIYIKMKDL